MIRRMTDDDIDLEKIAAIVFGFPLMRMMRRRMMFIRIMSMTDNGRY